MYRARKRSKSWLVTTIFRSFNSTVYVPPDIAKPN
jgi:hypothetical protein